MLRLSEGMRDFHKISIDDNGLEEVVMPRIPESKCYHAEHELRKAIREGFDHDAFYVFLTTRTNPEALEAYRDLTDERNPYFRSEHMNVYLEIIHELCSDSKIWHYSFPFIKNKNLHNGERDCYFQQAAWPVRHVIKADRKKTGLFITLVDSLNNDSVFEEIRKKEAPQNYCLAGFSLLKEKNAFGVILGKALYENIVSIEDAKKLS